MHSKKIFPTLSSAVRLVWPAPVSRYQLPGPVPWHVLHIVAAAASDGSTLSCFNRFNSAASFGWSSRSFAIYDGVMLKRTASATEQRKETINASSTYITSSTTSALVYPVVVTSVFATPTANASLTVINIINRRTKTVVQ